MTAGIKANVDGSAAIQVGGTDVIGLGSTGNINIATAGARITGDFSNATLANRVAFQTSTTNGNTIVYALPNGTASVGSFIPVNASDPTNAAYCQLRATSTETGLYSSKYGSGTFLPMTFYTADAERMRIDTSGNVGIGTSSPLQKLQVAGQSAVSGASGGFLMYDRTTSVSSSQWYSPSAGVTRLYDQVAATDRLGVDASGNFQFNSGYGSAATAYGCRAWVNFDGTSNTANLSGTYSQSGTTVTVTATAHGLIAGNVVYSDITTGTAVDGTYTVATVISSSQFTYTAGTSLTTSGNVTLRRNTIRASGNVSSIADNGTGDYTVNFSVAMPDANYSTQVTGSQTGATNGVTYGVISTGPATGSVRVINGRAAGALDSDYVNVAIFR